jgi:peptidoglycan/xylan/chitin deacetylase (PgdA/CDA1 family)
MKRAFFIVIISVLFLLLLTACVTNAGSAANSAQISNPSENTTVTPLVQEPVHPVLPTLTPTGEPVIAETEVCPANMIQADPDYDGELLYKFKTEEHFVVLTIDDGYYDDVMNEMLDMLEADGATATFFLLGRPVADNFTDETMQRLVNDGNDIAYHAYVHPAVEAAKTMTREEWNEDYQKWQEALRTKLGSELFDKAFAPYARVPYGPWTFEYLSFARENGLTPTFWSADNHAFEPKRMPLKDGGIIILHAVPEDIPVLQTMLEKDWKVVSLSEVMAESCK